MPVPYRADQGFSAPVGPGSSGGSLDRMWRGRRPPAEPAPGAFPDQQAVAAAYGPQTPAAESVAAPPPAAVSAPAPAAGASTYEYKVPSAEIQGMLSRMQDPYSSWAAGPMRGYGGGGPSSFGGGYGGYGGYGGGGYGPPMGGGYGRPGGYGGGGGGYGMRQFGGGGGHGFGGGQGFRPQGNYMDMSSRASAAMGARPYPGAAQGGMAPGAAPQGSPGNQFAMMQRQAPMRGQRYGVR